jgi:8-oxo-dGTP pyrophosphatase MutT (NUDIX family)
MNFEPEKFFIGLTDFFSVLLPGAVLTYLLMHSPSLAPVMEALFHEPTADAVGWAVFLFASYLLGHLVFLLGSWLDELYDWARRHTLNDQIARLARGGRPLPWLARALIWLVFKRERNVAVNRAVRIKQQALRALNADGAVNAFQWSKALLNIESPSSLAVVQRFEADSKFFRCFAVVLLITLLTWPWLVSWPLAAVPVVVVLLLMALWRYMEQRFKSTNQAYWSLIALTATAGKVWLGQALPNPTHAGGVVFRKQNGVAKYLLVQAKKNRTHWVLAKGHVEEAEDHREAAVREVHEETGVWARVEKDLKDVTYPVDGADITVRFFAMQFVGQGRQQDANRESKWLPLKEAIVEATHPETKELLGLFHGTVTDPDTVELNKI